MEAFLNHLVQFAAWVFVVIFVFAAIGLFATIRWIAGLVRRTEDAVGSGVQSAENLIHKH